jgi:tRNA threonylcarbamoyladenosine biosynthesis protein TsaB
MRILALDSALAQCAAAAVRNDQLIAERRHSGDRNQAALLPGMAAEVLEEAGWPAASLALIAVTVGPGSFTGIRAGLSLAHGIGLATGAPVIGVTVGEALAQALPPLGGRALWSAIDSRRGRVFLEQNGAVRGFALDSLPAPEGPVAVAGDAAAEVAARLAARGVDVMLTDARLPQPLHVAAVAAKRLAGELPPRAAQPLYVDAPEVRLPPSGLRPPPA